MDEKLLQIAKGNLVSEGKLPGYQPPENYEDDAGRVHKDKKMKALYGKYEDVGPATTDSKLWEQSQDAKAKNAYRTIDEIETKQNKQYNLLVENGIKFIKQNVINAVKKREAMNEIK